ncbi:sigma-70 family RNA polymerase sigma factor [Paenibacillus sp. JX-17]|uniref:Sigma-70 family RNA polymerase sigma factor n=1 Tax=Paenibacillus lacisoli TaxID=3064525 RepID=A0ABT9CEU2_9BACL|nr:sigma-70 family RNA polymerase sigma factor [Paenibacillus sp. JX-17]MDO7906477.1 sigma-70 family RNA polymerase sigma factor [Paenibacillus sp. JX-17]
MNNDDIIGLLNRMRDGEDAAFEELYQATKQDLYRTVCMLMGSRQHAVEVTNEIYVQVWKSFRTYRPGTPFRNWLHGVALRQISSFRQMQFLRWRIFSSSKHTADPVINASEQPVLQQEARDEMMRQISRLSEKLRVVLVLRYYQEYSFKEIAQLLEISLGTVKSRHHAALQKLKKQLGQRPGQEESYHVYRTSHSPIPAQLQQPD